MKLLEDVHFLATSLLKKGMFESQELNRLC